MKGPAFTHPAMKEAFGESGAALPSLCKMSFCEMGGELKDSRCVSIQPCWKNGARATALEACVAEAKDYCMIIIITLSFVFCFLTAKSCLTLL